jgi:hypothetical protein
VRGGEENQKAAIDHLQRALGFWDEVIAITRPLYEDMRLTAYNGNSRDANPNNLFHWALVRHEVAHNIDIARARNSSAATPIAMHFSTTKHQ